MQYTSYIDLAMQLIEQAEGFREDVYKCTAGKNTIGFGFNIDDNKEQYRLIDSFKNDDGEFQASKRVSRGVMFVQIIDICKRVDNLLLDLDSYRKAVIIDICFNIGCSGFLKFKKTIQAIKEGDFTKASEELVDSKWYKQVGLRGKRNAYIMKTGEYKNFY